MTARPAYAARHANYADSVAAQHAVTLRRAMLVVDAAYDRKQPGAGQLGVWLLAVETTTDHPAVAS